MQKGTKIFSMTVSSLKYSGLISYIVSNKSLKKNAQEDSLLVSLMRMLNHTIKYCIFLLLMTLSW